MNNQTGERQRPAGVFIALLLGTVSLIFLLFVLTLLWSDVGVLSAAVALGVWAGMSTLVWNSVHQHRHRAFGYANQITLARAVAAAALAGLVPIAVNLHSSTAMWAISIAAILSLCLDGLDGYMARRTGLSSVFGARFDMETDAFLALVIALFLWQSGKLGIWILGLGVMRYLFVFASIWLAPLKADLYPSMRRKAVCVIQIAALCVMVCPWVTSLPASVIGIVALGFLTYSFTVDVVWLLRQPRVPQTLGAKA